MTGTKKVNTRLPVKGNSNFHGARPVHSNSIAGFCPCRSWRRSLGSTRSSSRPWGVTVPSRSRYHALGAHTLCLYHTHILSLTHTLFLPLSLSHTHTLSRTHSLAYTHRWGGDGAESLPIPSLLPTPYTLHPTPYILHPTPARYTQHSTPSPLKSHPCTQTLNPQSLNSEACTSKPQPSTHKPSTLNPEP